MIDQAYQPRLSEEVRCRYMAGDRCAGFGHYKVKALIDCDGTLTSSPAVEPWGMKDTDRPERDGEDPEPKLSRLEEAVKIIEVYANDLRNIIKKIGRRLH